MGLYKGLGWVRRKDWDGFEKMIGIGLEKGLCGSRERVLMGPEIVLGWVRKKGWDGYGERVGMGPKKGLV